MEDCKKMGEDLLASSDMDSSVQQQDSTVTDGDRENSTENGQLPHQQKSDDMAFDLPSDILMRENDDFPDKHEDKNMVSEDKKNVPSGPYDTLTSMTDSKDEIQYDPDDRTVVPYEPDDKAMVLCESMGNASTPKNSDTNATADAKMEDAGHGKLPDKSDGDGAGVINQLEIPTPLKPEDSNMGKSKKEMNFLEMPEGDDSGTLEERAAFMKELENFYRERAMEFKPPKFYGEPLNCLKLWRAVIRLGGYDLVTASKLWRQVGESFHPPKTCTTVSWTFRIFYEKALLEYEKYKRDTGELHLPFTANAQPISSEKEASGYQAPGSGRTRRDAAARAMQGWHAQRYLGYGEVGEPIIKDKNLTSATKREKNLKSIGLLKKTTSNLEHAEKAAHNEIDKQLVTTVVDVGPPADWVKVNVRETRDCFEVYALVPGLLREEVRVQSDPAGRLVITGQPEQLDNPWGITPFKKVVSLPARIDPRQTSAVVSLHGRLFVRVPFEQGSS